MRRGNFAPSNKMHSKSGTSVGYALLRMERTTLTETVCENDESYLIVLLTILYFEHT